MGTEKAAILVADLDQRFLNTLKRDDRTSRLSIIHVTDGKMAKDAILDPENQLLSIFISPEIAEPSWLGVIKTAHLRCPMVPLHMIKSDRSAAKTLTDAELKNLGIKEVIDHELGHHEITRIVNPIIDHFDRTQAMRIAKNNTDQIGKESTALAHEFYPIRSNDFIAGVNSCFDVYAKTTFGRHIKLLHAGDDFDYDRLSNYVKKGVDFFYIRREAQKVYLQYCDHIASEILHSKEAPLELKKRQLMNSGNELINFVNINGLSEVSLEFAERYSSNLRLMLGQIGEQHRSILNRFMLDTTSYDHAVGVSMLAGVLANELDITSEGPMQTIAVACLFHDFALSSMPPACRTEDESKMTPAEIVLYREHPRLSAEALGMLPSSNLAAVQAIQQHHMKLKDKGFPTRNATTPVSRTSEIVACCNDLNHILKRCAENPELDQITEVEREIIPYYSRGVTNAFKKAFFPKSILE